MKHHWDATPDRNVAPRSDEGKPQHRPDKAPLYRSPNLSATANGRTAVGGPSHASQPLA